MMGFLVRRLAAMFMIAAMAGVAHATPPIETYGRLPGFERAALSPSGDRIAIIGVTGDQRRLVIIDRDKKVLTSAAVGNHKLRSISWAGEDKVLIQTSATVALGYGFTTSKTELTNMVVVSLTGKSPWAVFSGNRNITGGIRGFFGAIEREGRWYGYFGGITLENNDGMSNRLGSTREELYEVDLETGKAKRIARRPDSDTIRRDWTIAADGSVAASMDFTTADGSWTIRNRDRQPIASGKAPTGGIDLAGLGRTNETILYYSRENSGVGQLFEVPLAGGQPVEVIPDDSSNRTLFDEHRRLLIGYTRDGDMPEDHFFDERLEKRMAAARKAFPGKIVRLIDANAAFDRVIVRTDGPGDPQSWWVIDMNTRRAEQLGLSYAMFGEDVGPMRMFRYKAADGLEIGGVLTLPPGRDAKQLPVVILPHGGPQSRDYPVFDWWAQAYASRGYAVFQPNFRGSTGMGDAFRVAGFGEWGRKMQTDISDGLAALAKEGIVDPKRACIVGASYGGYASLAGVTLQQGLYRCAVSVAGVSDVYRMSYTDVRESGGDATLTRALKAEIGSGRDLKLVSPARFAERADAPILLIHGVDDIVVPFEQSQTMASALGRAGKQYELIKLVGEDHWLSRSETRLNMLSAAVAFVEKHNPPNPPAAH
ncbi:MAG: S9 family peptidase [Pseudomonadota bacterium]